MASTIVYSNTIKYTFSKKKPKEKREERKRNGTRKGWDRIYFKWLRKSYIFSMNLVISVSWEMEEDHFLSLHTHIHTHTHTHTHTHNLFLSGLPFLWLVCNSSSLDGSQFIKRLLNLLGTNHAFIHSFIWSALLNVRPYTNQVEHDNESTFTLLREMTQCT